MKLCFLAGADSIHSYRWIKFFVDKGHEIHWVSLTPNIFDSINGVKFYQLREFPAKPLDIFFNAIPFRKIIRKVNPDILHAHYAGVNGVLGALSGFHPYILTAWGSEILTVPRSRAIRPLIKFALKKADLITCDAEHMKKAMEKMEADGDKIKIIRFGIDTKKFSPGLKSEALLLKLGIKNCPVIISLRNLEPVYNIETLIMAIPMVLKEEPSAEFIIGAGGSEEKKLKNLTKELGVIKSVNFVGFISNQDLPDYLRTADVYVSTSLSDAGISSCTAEAMACGLPVVITNTGENKRWINDGKSGFLIGVKNPKVLAEKIITLLKEKTIIIGRWKKWKKFINKLFKMKRFKKIIKKIPILYTLSRNIYWKIRETKARVLGTGAQEQYWKKRNVSTGDDWEEGGDWVTSYWKSMSHPHRQVLIDTILRYSFSDVLEIGSNCGPNLYLLAKKRPEAKFIGVDINKKAVEVGNDLFLKNSISNVTLKTAKADELKCFKDKSFDIVFTDAVLMYIGPDKIRRIALEMKRLARKAIILLEHHYEEESALGKYNRGNWLRNYKALFSPLAKSIKNTKIPPELWGGDWGRLGYIIEILL